MRTDYDELTHTEQTEEGRSMPDAAPDEHPSSERTPAPSGPHGAPPVMSATRRRLRGALGLVGAALTVLVLAVGAQRLAGVQPAGAARDTAPPKAQATSTPKARASASPGATATPEPVADEGFSFYTDTANRFRIERPDDWNTSPFGPGVQFADDAKKVGFLMQVARRDIAPAPNMSDIATATTVIGDELSNIAKRWPQGSFAQSPGPSPAVTIGGVKWQTATGIITNNDSRIRVQVYATILDGKAYIINMLAADDRFRTGMTLFFSPMLASFAFLPAEAP